MTFSILRNCALTLLFVLGLTACDQIFGPGSAASITAPFRAIGQSMHSDKHTYHSHAYGRNGSNKYGTDPAGDPPGDPPAIRGGGDFWQHLRADFQLPPADNQPQVQAQIRWFAHNQGYLTHTIRRAAPYMYFILQETQKRNLPGELVLLPINESAYNPFAGSWKGAVGLWQLMPGTAYGLGIKQDWWFDGRRDIYASTNAALDYLTYLQSFFGGDWLLAMAAYDTGEGNVQRAIHRNNMLGRPTDFWSLDLAQETRSYVPRLLALVAIIRDPARYGIQLPPISDQPYLQQVDLGAPINLTQAAQLAGMSLGELKQLNPGYNHTTTDPNGPYKLLLPIDRIALFKQQLAALPGVVHTTWGRYRVQPDDTLTSIAQRYQISITELKRVNHIRAHVAPVGKVIMIPTGTESAVPHIVDTNNTLPSTNATANNLTATARDLGARQAVSELLHQQDIVNNRANTNSNNSAQHENMDENNSDADLAANSAAETPVQTQSDKVVTGQKQYHTVKRGETLANIAHRYNVKISQLQRWNNIKNIRDIQPGTRLIVKMTKMHNGQSQQNNHHAQAAKSSSHHIVANKSHSKKIVANAASHQKMNSKLSHYTVKSGDTLSSIARHTDVKVADLRKWNHISASGALKPGRHLVVYAER